MIAVAIIGILAGIAYPNYRDYIVRANRAEARTMLLENAQFLERNFTTANRYDQTSGGDDIDDESLPHGQSPENGTAKYTITVNFPDSQRFTLSAAPTGSMAGDGCGTLTLTNTGAQGRSGAGHSVADCWGR
ncbi:type IV pilin protein [Thauera sinica]